MIAQLLQLRMSDPNSRLVNITDTDDETSSLKGHFMTGFSSANNGPDTPTHHKKQQVR